MKDNPKPEERVCYNCKHLLWMIGIGQGLRCGHSDEDKRMKTIPSRRYTCEKFEKKETNK